MAKARRRKAGGSEGDAASAWEWVVGALGAAAVAGALGYLVFTGATRPDTPPDLVVTPGPARPVSAGFVVELRVRNDGGQTAAGVRVVGALRSGDAVVEESEFTLPFVPPGSERRGGLFFTHDPSALALEVRATGYETP